LRGFLSDSSPCTFLEWDSNFFGRRIARVTGQRMDADLASEISEWARDHKIDCMYFLADAADSRTIVSAEKWNAHFVDIRIALRTEITQSPAGSKHPIRTCTSADLPALRHIARTSHRDGRFFYDPRFLQDQCESFYEKWILRSYEGFADAVLIGDVNGKAAGYVTCHLESSTRAGRIGLFAIGEEARGLGIGQALASEALRWFANKEVDHVNVVTQGRNVAAQRLYGKCGFRIHSVSLWYHKWFDNDDGTK
jgi:dTDP-4-amino-4,6-dideoxy-D-galactose acyltransferase